MDFFRIKGPDFWGDYGTVLAGGSDQGRDCCGRLRLRRTGPFMPPITVPLSSEAIVVSDSFRLQLTSIFPHLLFRPVVKEKIVEIHWEKWDRQEPPLFPEGGEPENYHSIGEHSAQAAAGLGEIWELVMSEVTKSKLGPRPASVYEPSELIIDETSWDGSHFFLTTPVSFPIGVVTEIARQHLVDLVPDWITFLAVTTIGEKKEDAHP